MATIVTRAGKGSALTFNEADANFTNLNTDKIELTDLSVGAEATASGNGAIGYDNTTGVLTYTPPTAAGIGALANVSEDSSPTLGGTLDTNDNAIVSTGLNALVTLGGGGSQGVKINGTGGLNVVNGNIFTDGNVISLNNGVGGTDVYYFKHHGEQIYASTTTSGTYNPDPNSGPIHYVALTGNMTINGFTNGLGGGETVTILFDGSGGSYTLTLGAGIYTPGGSLALTAGGYDLVTITSVDESVPFYIATAVNDFQ